MCSHCRGSHPTQKYFRQQINKKDIRNHPSICANIIITVIKVMVGNQIHATDLDQSIISPKNFQKPDTSDKKVNGNTESLKLVRAD